MSCQNESVYLQMVKNSIQLWPIGLSDNLMDDKKIKRIKKLMRDLRIKRDKEYGHQSSKIHDDGLDPNRQERRRIKEQLRNFPDELC
ncbi:MAG: hypothetical protein WC942_05255 [Clostridia bacterium]|jgi:hypothetical protein